MQWNERVLMDDESGESMEPMVDGEKPGADSSDEGKHTGRNDLLFVRRENDVDGRATVIKDEERMLRGG